MELYYKEWFRHYNFTILRELIDYSVCLVL